MTVLNGIGWKGRGSSKSSPSTVTVRAAMRAVPHQMMPVARRFLGERNETTLWMRWNHARALYENEGATLDNLREAVTTLGDVARIARRVLGSAHPTVLSTEKGLRGSRATLAARETPDA